MKEFTSDQITEELQKLKVPQYLHTLCLPLWNTTLKRLKYDVFKTKAYFKEFIEMVEGKRRHVYKITFKKEGLEYNVRIFKVPYQQQAVVSVDSTKSVFKFGKEGVELLSGHVPEVIMEDIVLSIMKYCYVSRIHS